MNKKIFTKNIKIIHNILSQLNIKYFLLGGTLLGAIRENDFIDYDYDVDIGIFYEDIVDKIDKLKESLEKNNFIFWCEYGVINEGYCFQYIKDSIFRVDFDVVYRLSETKSYYGLSVGPHNDVYKLYKYEVPINNKILEYDRFKPLEITYIPENYEKYLETEYGDWKTPRKETINHWIERNLKNKDCKHYLNGKVVNDFIDTTNK